MPLPIFECLDAWASGETIEGSVNPALAAKSKSFILNNGDFI